MSSPVLQLKKVSKIYEIDGLEIPVLHDINLSIKSGEFIAIMGPSGSGKSTLMYIIGCLDRATEGIVIIDSYDVSKLSEEQLAKIRNKKIGFVFQMFNLLPRTSAFTNITLPLIYSQNNSHTEGAERAHRLMERLGIAHRESHFPSQLSGGEQQRVAIARALINQPSIILADEPTGNLDSKSGKEILQIFKDLHHEGNTIIIVTHDPKVAAFAHKIIYIEDGRIVRSH